MDLKSIRKRASNLRLPTKKLSLLDILPEDQLKPLKDLERAKAPTDEEQKELQRGRL